MGYINEDYQSTVEIKKLSNLIIRKVVDINYDNYQSKREFDYIYGVGFDQINEENFDKLRDFIKYTILYVYFIPKKNSGKLGSYKQYPNKEKKDYDYLMEREIKLFYPYDVLKENMDRYINTDRFTKDDLHKKYDAIFGYVLDHELQHAYDDFRSQGMAFNTKEIDKFIKKYGNENISYDVDKYRDYINLPHEIWGNFTQAISKTTPHKIEEVNGNKQLVINPLNNFIDEFTNNLEGYDVMNEKNKRKLIRKASQMWHLEQDKMKEINEKLLNKQKG